MAVFHLYRLTVMGLDSDVRPNRGRIILSAIKEKPSKEIRDGHTWHIGNVEEVEGDSVFFLLGRVSGATREFYDKGQGDFTESASEETSRTHIAVDLNLQVCAIAQKSAVAQNVDSIARNLAKLLSASSKAKNENLKFALSGISDPDGFLEFVRNARRITSFEMTLSHPNPWDAEDSFHEPLKEAIKALKAKKGKFSANGEKLDAGIVEALTRSTASTGDNIRARIQSEGEAKPVLRRLGGRIRVLNEEPDTDQERKSLLEKVRDAYRRVRNQDRLT